MKRELSIPFSDTILIGDMLGDSNDSLVLFLHGAGTADRKRFDAIRNKLFGKGFSSVAFDFIGHGETGGNLEASSLQQRTEQALRIIEELGLQQPLHIVAASMGGYTALKIAEAAPVASLIFLAPAVYSTSAYAVPFNGGFSDIIRQTDSWQDSDAWDILKSYTNKLLILEAELDHIVPKGVIQKIYDSASHASERKIITIPEGTHPLGKYLDEHPEALERVFSQIIEVLK